MYVISAGELFLKGKNLHTFEDCLIRNMIRLLDLKKGELIKKRFKYLIQREECSNLKYLFGISNYAKVIVCNFDEINNVALNLIKKEKSFRVTCKRSTKTYKSSELANKEVGAYIVKNKKIRVDLRNFEIEICIEIIDDKAYVYSKKIDGLGGLPVGVTGDVLLDIKGEERKSVAGFLMMKRGCNVINAPKVLEKFGCIKKNRESVIVKDCDLEDIKKEDQLVLYPLLGYSDKEVDKMYKEIIDL